MPKKTVRNKKATTKRFARLTRWGLRLAVLLLGVFLVIAIILDGQIRKKFEGKKWSVPARVYARPLEIHEGQLLKISELKRELDSLAYTHVKKVYGPGQYSQQANVFHIITRDFTFPDKEQASDSYRVQINNGVVEKIQGLDQELVLRLDPKEIGSIYPNHGEDRVLVTLDDVPPLLATTLIAVEDKDFAHHFGLSFTGIARAMIVNIKAGRFVQGGSTLTQQLIKNFYLNHRKTLSRKLQEMAMAPLLELHYSKGEILEAYLNEVYLGQSGPRAIHGFGLASKHYFNRSLKNLRPHQVALLVGLVKGASYYNPWRFPERAKKRRDLVLQLMAYSELITEKEKLAYQKKSLGVIKKHQLRLGDYPAFMSLVKRQLLKDYHSEDLQSEGLRIFTTMSPGVQELTESTIRNRLKQFNQSSDKPLQSAGIVTAVGSGEVLAMVGDANPRYSGFNRALDMKRPIGSLIKPFVYMTALANPSRYTLTRLLDDSPVSISLPNGQIWQPKNFDKQSHGNIPLYRALANSYNQSAVHVGMDVGLPAVIKNLHAAGLQTSLRPLPALLLGAVDLSPLEVSHIYHTVAADGVYTPLRAIREVLNANNQRLQRYPLKSEPRIPAALNYLLHYNLKAVMREGSGRSAYRQLPADLSVAGKTGTTNKQRDSWFAGYSADHLGVFWVGNDKNAPTAYTGSRGALLLWTDIFKQLSTGSISFIQPDNIEYYRVDKNTGNLVGKGCESAILVPYIAGSQPQEKSDCGEASVQQWFQQWFGGNGPVNVEEEDSNEFN